MPYVRTVPYQEASGPLKAAYDDMLGERGRIPNVYAISSIRTETMKTLQKHNDQVMRDPTSGLTEAERQMIATLVSSLNKCQY